MKTTLKGTLLRLLVSFGAIGAIVYFMRGELHEALNVLKSGIIWSWFIIAAVIYFLANLLLAYRQMLVLKSQTIHLTYGESVYLAFLGLFFNLIFPSAVGGDVAKAYYAYKHSGKKIESMSAILQDRLVGFVVIIIMAIVALAVIGKGYASKRVYYIVYGFLGVMVFAVCFFSSRRFARVFTFAHFLIPTEKLKGRLKELYYAIYNFKNHLGIFFSAFILSFIIQGIFILVHYLVALSLNVYVEPIIFFIVIPVVAIVSMAPSIGGLGVREAGLIFFLKNYMPNEKALVLSILLDMIIYGHSLGSGIVFAVKGGLKQKMIHEMEGLEK